MVTLAAALSFPECGQWPPVPSPHLPVNEPAEQPNFSQSLRGTRPATVAAPQPSAGLPVTIGRMTAEHLSPPQSSCRMLSVSRHANGTGPHLRSGCSREASSAILRGGPAARQGPCLRAQRGCSARCRLSTAGLLDGSGPLAITHSTRLLPKPSVPALCLRSGQRSSVGASDEASWGARKGRSGRHLSPADSPSALPTPGLSQVQKAAGTFLGALGRERTPRSVQIDLTLGQMPLRGEGEEGVCWHRPGF